MTEKDSRSDRAKSRQELVKTLSFVFQIALSALCPIFILILAGIRLDERFGKGNHWFVLIGAVTGIYSAYRSTYLLIRDSYKDREEPDKAGKEKEKP